MIVLSIWFFSIHIITFKGKCDAQMYMENWNCSWVAYSWMTPVIGDPVTCKVDKTI